MPYSLWILAHKMIAVLCGFCIIWNIYAIVARPMSWWALGNVGAIGINAWAIVGTLDVIGKIRALRYMKALTSFTCPRCLRTSYNPNDAREGYCGACHDWTGKPIR